MHIFIVHTDYHVICTLSIVAEKKWAQTVDEEVLIFYATTNAEEKLRRYHTELASYLTFMPYEYNDWELDGKNSPIAYIENAIQRKVLSRIFIFNQHTLLASYLLAEFRGQVIFGLVQDGLKAYLSNSKVAPRWRTLTWLNWQKRILSRQKRGPIIAFPSLVYGKLPGVDELWLSLPNSFHNVLNKTICGFNLLADKKSFDLAISFFKWVPPTYIDEQKPIVLYLSQPIDDKRFSKLELDMIQLLKAQFQTYNIQIKPHPSSKYKELNEALRSIKGVELIEAAVPAELLIANLPSHSKVYSFWSTASLFEGNAQHFWLYRILEEEGLSMQGLSIINPTKHIIEVESKQNLDWE